MFLISCVSSVRLHGMFSSQILPSQPFHLFRSDGFTFGLRNLGFSLVDCLCFRFILLTFFFAGVRFCRSVSVRYLPFPKSQHLVTRGTLPSSPDSTRMPHFFLFSPYDQPSRVVPLHFRGIKDLIFITRLTPAWLFFVIFTRSNNPPLIGILDLPLGKQGHSRRPPHTGGCPFQTLAVAPAPYGLIPFFFLPL